MTSKKEKLKILKRIKMPESPEYRGTRSIKKCLNILKGSDMEHEEVEIAVTDCINVEETVGIPHIPSELPQNARIKTLFPTINKTRKKDLDQWKRRFEFHSLLSIISN